MPKSLYQKFECKFLHITKTSGLRRQPSEQELTFNQAFLTRTQTRLASNALGQFFPFLFSFFFFLSFFLFSRFFFSFCSRYFFTYLFPESNSCSFTEQVNENRLTPARLNVIKPKPL